MNEFLSEGMTPRITVYVDMDGVLADFDGSALTNEPVRAAREKLDWFIRTYAPEFAGKEHEKIKSATRGPQTDPRMKKLKRLFNDWREKTYRVAGREGFFRGLQVLPGAEALLAGIASITGAAPHILTGPMTSNRWCVQEKEEWMRAHFPGQFAQFFCTPEKHRHASGPWDVLIDDRQKYLKPFASAGGTALHYTGDPGSVLRDLDELVARFEHTPES
jgi:5'(3')-deoxyribonucleotidase